MFLLTFRVMQVGRPAQVLKLKPLRALRPIENRHVEDKTQNK